MSLMPMRFSDTKEIRAMNSQHTALLGASAS
eukprot:CAMPEP_0114645050 /NCGR_PEP_ID=MMETSP0191-20121206/4323_1 /TAXON_ID=126664 /ORGANISM="Sorites sp." /LENGTH=30 /DNA_ID= /DNA_START= /DNA_END= /DNA_ORIENTATION=